MPVLKNLISPFQKALLNKRLCPGCTAPLDKAKRFPFETIPESIQEMVICSCRRMFIYDKNTDGYRRASMREAEIFAKETGR